MEKCSEKLYRVIARLCKITKPELRNKVESLPNLENAIEEMINHNGPVLADVS